VRERWPQAAAAAPFFRERSLRSLIQKVRKGTGIRIYISAVYIVSVEGNVDVAKKILYMKARALRALVNHSLDHDPTIVILTFLSSHAQIFSRSHAGPSRAPFGKLPFTFLHSSSLWLCSAPLTPDKIRSRTLKKDGICHNTLKKHIFAQTH